MSAAPLPVFHVLGRPYYLGGEARFLAWLLKRSKAPRPVHVANVHTSVSALWDAELERSQREATLSLADGRPLSLAGKLLGCWEAGQLQGPPLMLSCARQGLKAGMRHFYYGGAAGVAQSVAAELRRLAPGLKVAGAVSPPFRDLSERDLRSLVARLKRSRTDILWVGLGAPKQEKLMARLARLGAPCAMLGVGAGFDYYAGRKREAPVWVKRLVLEWAYRLVSEPGRLWWRYLSTNLPFVALLGLEYAGLFFGARRPWWERGLRLASLACAGVALVQGSPGMALGLSALPLLWGRLAWLAAVPR